MKKKLLSAGIVVIRRSAEGCHYLLLRAYTYWDFPKGLVEPGEGPLEAARREVEEETGIAELEFPWGNDYRETGPYGQGKVARYYVASTRTEQVYLPVSPELGRPEHHEYRWVSYTQAHELLSQRLHPVLLWARKLTGCDS
jgi:bis(5'-nucleosidyl)-tetraphosphatase